MAESDTATRFHATGTDADGCRCPIHGAHDIPPFTAPLGLSFADDVTVEPIPDGLAERVYQSHHAYMDSIPSVNLGHHGLRFRGQLMGAITYRYPLLSRKRVYFDAEGGVRPPKITDSDVRSLPESLRATARRILPVGNDAPADAEVVSGDRFVEAARICLGVRMANLASASLARSQDRAVNGVVCDDDVRFLLTFVRADYDGAMVRALRSKGWTCVGWTEPRQAGNREDRRIRERHKWVFLCPAETIEQQATLDNGAWSA